MFHYIHELLKQICQIGDAVEACAESICRQRFCTNLSTVTGSRQIRSVCREMACVQALTNKIFPKNALNHLIRMPSIQKKKSAYIRLFSTKI